MPLEAAEFGIETIERPVGDPARIDVGSSQAFCDKYGNEPTASLCRHFGRRLKSLRKLMPYKFIW
ncbi:hypothetical protein [Pleomorphomonas carboxyditropha]|uniref:Uncharacterized protein n=1 Tax=Pleomorphomonas carboxyditropha TaxID=2023338 RepID=A0A2G9WZU5_9HYPH|nr:hypothetical protein [Pleomorphomonas carboxyditropha]PIP00190.1 hypothetical protein CJ014_05480 [Pleomorphomonas carboxyditropha]